MSSPADDEVPDAAPGMMERPSKMNVMEAMGNVIKEALTAPLPETLPDVIKDTFPDRFVDRAKLVAVVQHMVDRYLDLWSTMPNGARQREWKMIHTYLTANHTKVLFAHIRMMVFPGK